MRNLPGSTWPPGVGSTCTPCTWNSQGSTPCGHPQPPLFIHSTCHLGSQLLLILHARDGASRPVESRTAAAAQRHLRDFMSAVAEMRRPRSLLFGEELVLVQLAPAALRRVARPRLPLVRYNHLRWSHAFVVLYLQQTSGSQVPEDDPGKGCLSHTVELLPGCRHAKGIAQGFPRTRPAGKLLGQHTKRATS